MFSITPAESGNVPLSPQNFPKQLQFRFNGVDLGGPDATVLDIVGTGFTMTVGAGLDEHTIFLQFT